MQSNSASGSPYLLQGRHYATGEPIAVEIRQDRIANVTPAGKRETEAQMWIGPGLVDLQINGYRGADFNTPPYDADMIIRTSRALTGEGITSYYPTIATNSPEAIEEAVRAIARACGNDELTNRLIAGIHLEGPFISAQDGVRGVHNPAYVRAPDWSLFERWQQASGKRIAIVTLSPEWPGSAGFIAGCTAGGVKVAIGHTSASAEQIREAVEAGACLSTHLGNGAHLTLPRHPNYIWEQLAQEGLAASVIADGEHLPASVLKIIMKIKGERLFIVSDASFLSGMPPGEYATDLGGRVVLTPEGRLHLASDSRLLAGSAKMQPQAITHMYGSGITSFKEAWEMCSIRPASFMKLPAARGLEAQAVADLTLFAREGNAIKVIETYKQGQLVYRAGGRPLPARSGTSLA